MEIRDFGDEMLGGHQLKLTRELNARQTPPRTFAPVHRKMGDMEPLSNPSYLKVLEREMEQ
jgi:hypothetical protein